MALSNGKTELINERRFGRLHVLGRDFKDTIVMCGRAVVMCRGKTNVWKVYANI